MRISHPAAPYQGIPPENVFFVSSDQHVQLGVGYVMPFFQQALYPERPLHLYLNMESQPSAQSLLFGALLARSEQLRAQTPQYPARLYTQIRPEDAALLAFFQRNGFKNDDAEDMVRFPLPNARAQVPMALRLYQTPLRNEAEQQALLARLNAYRIAPIDQDFFTLCMQQQHFVSLGLYREHDPVAEIVLAGAGAQVTLVMLYVQESYRRRGLARCLLASAADMLREQQVRSVAAVVLRRNAPQTSLVKSLDAVFLRTLTLYPGVNLDPRPAAGYQGESNYQPAPGYQGESGAQPAPGYQGAPWQG